MKKPLKKTTYELKKNEEWEWDWDKEKEVLINGYDVKVIISHASDLWYFVMSLSGLFIVFELVLKLTGIKNEYWVRLIFLLTIGFCSFVAHKDSKSYITSFKTKKGAENYIKYMKKKEE